MATSILTVPYASQRDNATGTGWRECFSSSCAMVAMFWGKVRSDDEYNARRIKHGDTTEAHAQIETLRELGLRVSFWQTGTQADLIRVLSAGRPVAVGWLHKGHVATPRGGHWSVIVGADQAGAVTLPPRTARTTPPSVVPVSAPPARPSVPPARASAPIAPRPVAASGAWRIQLGAFATKANADALWAKVRTRADIAGHARIDVPGQGITRLQARGFASEAEANRACAALKAGGLACLVIKP